MKPGDLVWAKAKIIEYSDGRFGIEIEDFLMPKLPSAVITAEQVEKWRKPMTKEYKSPCRCVIHVIQWTARRKLVTQKSCPTHKNAEKTLDSIKALKNDLRAMQATANKRTKVGRVGEAMAGEIADRLGKMIAEASDRGERQL
jgi:mRNA-degrading endonuclease toxin of MazEF toxin-antitoxin module